MQRITTADQLDLWVTGTAAKIALSNEVWQVFGYRRRPQRGSLLTKLLAKLFPRKIAKEWFLVRHITAASIGTLATRMGRRRVDPPELAARAVEILVDQRGTPEAFGFQSPGEAGRYLAGAVGAYMDADDDGRASVLIRRFQEELGIDPTTEWIAGSIKLTVTGFSPADNEALWYSDHVKKPVDGSVALSRPELLAAVVKGGTEETA